MIFGDPSWLWEPGHAVPSRRLLQESPNSVSMSTPPSTSTMVRTAPSDSHARNRRGIRFRTCDHPPLYSQARSPLGHCSVCEGVVARALAATSNPAAGMRLIPRPGCRIVARMRPAAAPPHMTRATCPLNARLANATSNAMALTTAAAPTATAQYSVPVSGEYSSWTSSLGPALDGLASSREPTPRRKRR